MQETKSPVNEPMSEKEIDENLEESFPASDPPSWNSGTDHGAGAAKTKNAQSPLSKREANFLSRPVNENDHMQGADTALITLLMYGAYECPHCVEGSRIVKQIQQEFGEDLRFVFRHFPRTNVHPHAEAAAEVAEAAGEQGKFWTMHDKLFENYNRLDGEHLIGYAEELNLDMEQFDRAITGRVYAGKVREDLQSGTESGVKGTPTYFINGIRHDAPGDLDVLRAGIQNIINN